MNEDTRPRADTARGQHLSLWMTRDEICSRLAISPRTLRRRVVQSSVEHRRDGSRHLYRLTEASAAKRQRPQGHERTRPEDTASMAELSEARAAITSLVALVGELRTELAVAKSEREKLTGRLSEIEHLVSHLVAQEDSNQPETHTLLSWLVGRLAKGGSPSQR